MPDYQKMYLHLMRETEKAVRILVQAQQDCEEICLNSPEPSLVPLAPPPSGGETCDT